MATTTRPAVVDAVAPRGATRQDRLSEFVVIAITVVALLAGALLKLAVENRTNDVRSGDVTLYYPADWQVNTNVDQSGVVRIRDTQSSSAFPTTLEFEKVTIDPSKPATQTLSLVANDMALTRGKNLSGFKVFNVSANQTIKGLAGTKVRYVFVNTPGSIFQESVPAVVIGDDYLVAKGDSVYVFTLNATEDRRADALPVFQNFVDSAQLP